MMSKKEIRISDIIIPKYHPVFNDTEHRHIILTSGRAGTKSSFAAIRADYQLMADRNASVVVLRKRHNKLRKTVYKEMIRGIHRLQVPKSRFNIGKSPMEITYRQYGTTMYFAGSDGIDDTKGIIDEDKPIRLVVLDELTEFFDDGEGEDELANIEATFIRGNRSGFQMIYLYNPPKNPNAPVNQWCRKMEQRQDCLHIHTDYRDVPMDWLGQALIESAEMMMRIDLKMYRWTWLGESVGIDELIYYMFSADDHVARPGDGQTYPVIGIGVDYGQMNATTYQAFGLHTAAQRFQGLGEYYHSGRDTGRQKSPSEYAEDFKAFKEQLEAAYSVKRIEVFIDPSAKGLAEEIKRKCPAVRIMDADNAVALGISRHQKLLTYDVMHVSPDQVHMIEEYGQYEYDRKSIEAGKEVPVKKNDHCQDATRYCIMGLWKKLKYFLPKAVREDEKDGDNKVSAEAWI